MADGKEKTETFIGDFNNDFNNDFNINDMAMKTTIELKDTFCGMSGLVLVKGAITDLSTIDWSLEVPVLVDSLSYSEGEPTKNSVKVHGIPTDWCTMYEAGETTFSFQIPTKSPEVLEFFWGTPTNVTSTINGASWKGDTYQKESKQIKFGFGIISGDGESMFIVKEVEAVASNVFESATTQPYLVQVNGSVTSSDFTFLTKQSAG